MNIKESRDEVTFEVTDPGVLWFINECGDTYPYPAHLQGEHFPNDFHTGYVTEDDARWAADRL